MQDFSYAYYEHILETAISSGYHVTSFKGYSADAPKTVILRHDVDYTLDGLLVFAGIEKKLGVTASYLFRVHADEYNLFSCVSWNILRQLVEMGHEIGLHFEAMNVGRALKLEPKTLLRMEKDALEAILGPGLKLALSTGR